MTPDKVLKLPVRRSLKHASIFTSTLVIFSSFLAYAETKIASINPKFGIELTFTNDDILNWYQKPSGTIHKTNEAQKNWLSEVKVH